LTRGGEEDMVGIGAVTWEENQMHRGISLIEVLVAIFVLTVGLMGIAMVIPAGNVLMVEALKNDRGTACGRAVLNDAQIRGWLKPDCWRQMRDSGMIRPNWYYLNATVNNGGTDYLPYGEVFLVDPYFFLERFEYFNPANMTTLGPPTVRHFPYNEDPFNEFALLGNAMDRKWPRRALARRVTPHFHSYVGIDLTVAKTNMAIADRITTWNDDLIFTNESDNRRPRQMFSWSNGENAAFPFDATDGNSLDTNADGAPDFVRLSSSNEGKFKWALMVAPIMPTWQNMWWDHDGNPSTPAVPMVSVGSIAQYEVSVIVFYSRNTYCPNETEIAGSAADIEVVRERSVYAQLIGGGIGGGDVLLFAANSENRPASWLNIKKNQWIMLKALDRTREIGGAGGVMQTRPTVCKWYRVTGVDDVQAVSIPDPTNLTGTPLSGQGRYVTLAGPDWEVITRGSVSGGFSPQMDIAEAAIIEDVAGVYTTIVNAGDL
jgi:hypothetical protein